MNKSKKNRSLLRRVGIIVLLPVMIVVWMVGWILYVIGDQRKETEPAHQKIITALKKKEHEEENQREASPQEVMV